MDIDKFKAIYAESRNGCNHFVQHPLCRRFVYSDGVQELAETGCYWLLDIIGTEFVDAMRKHPDRTRGQIDVHVGAGRPNVGTDAAATIRLTFEDDGPLIHGRHIDFTDLPDGDWTFLIANDDGRGEIYSMILVTEY